MPKRNAEQRMSIVPRLFLAVILIGVGSLVGLIYALVA